ncbi:MAG TPA: NAD-dependent protein deacetylase [Gammaproteobacteria bacterium]|nr:NAD-dependent protein deacetylase [Gammaproteobacteria bacterium]
MTARLLEAFVTQHHRLFVLTGAGVSTGSGIPDYRDADGEWKRSQPITLQAFLATEHARRRYWARSLIGWRRMTGALPNDAHHSLAALERLGRIEQLVTQNVDGLHQAAGSRKVIDLHGRVDVVRCLDCGRRSPRARLQAKLLARNPSFAELHAADAPDGDADLEGVAFDAFEVPQCEWCGGLLKPDVVFFGESVPRERVASAFAAVERADAMLVVGSSLKVYSGFRFAAAMAAAGKPIAAVNLGKTRADDLLALKVTEHCADALAFLRTEPAAERAELSPLGAPAIS